MNPFHTDFPFTSIIFRFCICSKTTDFVVKWRQLSFSTCYLEIQHILWERPRLKLVGKIVCFYQCQPRLIPQNVLCWCAQVLLMSPLNVLFLKEVSKMSMKINKQNHEQVKIKLNTLKKKFALCLVLSTLKGQVDKLNLVESAN